MARESEEELTRKTDLQMVMYDFYFDRNGNFVQTEGEEGVMESIVADLLTQHQAYHKRISDTRYVPVGSILACTNGSTLVRMGAGETTGVYVGNGAPVMTCSDCKAGENIPTFGGCRAIMVDGLPGRELGAWGNVNAPAGESYTPFGAKCVPVIDGEWKQPGKGKVLIWRPAGKEYSCALKKNAVLTCRYGGIIGVVEISDDVRDNVEEIADVYVVSERIKLRDSPNGAQIGGDRALKEGAIVKPHESKETQEAGGKTWIKIYYDVDKTGWVGLDYLERLPEPVKNYNFGYRWEKSPYVTQEFKDKAAGVAIALGIDPDNLMGVMAFESYGFNPAQKNMAGGSATGLVQFMPGTAQELNTTTDELAKMSGVEQLDYVYGYFYPYKGKLKDLGDIYMRVLSPESIGIGEDEGVYRIGDGKYEANEGLDKDDNKIITKKEAANEVSERMKEYK